MIKVLIADDQELIRESLKIVLNTHEDLQVIDTVEDGFGVLDSLKRNIPDVILMDIRMPRMDGVYCTKMVKEAYPDQAILTVVSGGAMINPDIATKVFRLFSKMANTNYAINVNDDNVRELNKPEWKVIQQVGFGLSNKEIAQKLFLSEGTVRNYLSSILSKLELRDRTQLAIWAVQTGQTTKDLDDD